MAKLMEKRTFVRSGEGAVASYDYYDVSEGTGLINFYLGYGKDGGVLSKEPFYSITKELVYSGSGMSVGGTYSSGYYTFELPAFQMPKIISGTMRMQYCFSFPGSLSDYYCTIRVLKNSSVISTFTGQVLSGTKKLPEYLTQELPTTKFSAGDVLKIQIRFTFTIVNNVTQIIAVGTDPINRDGTYITPSTDDNLYTSSKVSIPFKIDI